MSIASEITSMGENLKKDYQSIANLGADLTNVDKNIENIAELLDGVYDNLPKTEYQEGTEITLSNTLKGKLDYENGVVGIGQTEQDSTQGYNELNIYAVHSAGYTETVSGVTFKYNDDGSVTANGTATADINYFLGSRATLGDIFNGTYYLSGCKTGSNTTYYLSMWTEGIGVYPQTTTEVATNKTSGVNWNIVIAVKNGASVNYTFYPMMSKTSGKSFEPYTGGQASPNPSYPQTINSVTGNQDVVVSGKNKLPPIFNGNITRGNLTITKNNDGTYTLNGNTGSTDEYIQGVDVESFGIKAQKLVALPTTWNSDKGYCTMRYVGNTWSNNDTGAGTTLDNTKTIKFFALLLRANSSFDNVVIKPMLTDDLADTYNDYEPYITPTSYQLSLGDIELCGIGDYKDELVYDVDEDKVYKANRIAKHVLTENDGWVYDGTTYNRIYNQSGNFLNPPCKIPSSNDDPPNILCNYLMNYNATTFLADNSLNGITLSQNGTISARNTSKTTLEQYKSWLNEVKPVLYYVIGTQAQTLTEITDTTLINQVKALYNAHSNNGTTIITSNGNLPMIIKCRGLKGE